MRPIVLPLLVHSFSLASLQYLEKRSGVCVRSVESSHRRNEREQLRASLMVAGELDEFTTVGTPPLMASNAKRLFVK